MVEDLQLSCFVVIIIVQQVKAKMHLRYYLDANGKRIYTLQLTLPDGSYTLNAHPGTSHLIQLASAQTIGLVKKGLSVKSALTFLWHSNPSHSFEPSIMLKLYICNIAQHINKKYTKKHKIPELIAILCQSVSMVLYISVPRVILTLGSMRLSCLFCLPHLLIGRKIFSSVRSLHA
jgi:hypothetical protein